MTQFARRAIEKLAARIQADPTSARVDDAKKLAAGVLMLLKERP